MFQLIVPQLQDIATWFITNMRLSKMQVSMEYPEGLPMRMGFECEGGFIGNSGMGMGVTTGDNAHIKMFMPKHLYGKALYVKKYLEAKGLNSTHEWLDVDDYETPVKTFRYKLHQPVTIETLDHYKALFIEALRHAGIEGIE
jgi:hypothetical protein